MKVTNMEELLIKINEVKEAEKIFSTYSQKQVDEIFKKAATAASEAKILLAKMAVEESGMGIIEDKVIKNHFASEYVYNKYKNEKTCGIIERDRIFGITKIAEPIGVIGAVIPTTNPTSTAIFKALLALKTRNGIIFSPHPRAKQCTIEAVKIILNAAVKAGAPKNIIGWIDEPSLDMTHRLMEECDLILATGGPSMVKAAYSSGKPAIGVGAGNAPAIIDETADIKMAVSSILLSKTFDNGVACAAEQSVVVVDSVYDEVKDEFRKRGAYFLKNNEVEKVRKVLLINGSVNAKIVGQSAYKIAEIAGFNINKDAKVLVGEVESAELEEPFSHEKLSPILAMYRVKDFEEAISKGERLVELGGLGHTSALYTNITVSMDRVDEFGKRMKTSRITVNSPATQGAIGDIYNSRISPALTLGCGSWGGNSVSENIAPKHLINIKSVAERRESMLGFKIPENIYYKFGALDEALVSLKNMNKKKAFIVTDKFLVQQGYVDRVTRILEENRIDFRIFTQIEPDPTIGVVEKGAKMMGIYNPDTIIALGGGSVMDAAKVMWTLYEHPEIDLESLAIPFMDMSKRICDFPKIGEKAMLVAIPTTAGTGSEVTPFAVITNEKMGVKYPLASYELTPNMAIIDASLMLNMPKSLTASSGIDALVHAIEAYTSVMASEFTDGLALEAIRLIFKYLPQAYKDGAGNIKAREKMAYASTVAGMAFANAFLGICHSMAHKLGAQYHLAHGVAIATLIEEVIRFNATDNPTKQATFPQYKYPNAKKRYANICNYIGIEGKTDDEKVEKLIEAISKLKEEIGLPKNISECGISKMQFYKALDDMSEKAFDDQCTGANPRYPLISEIKEIYLKAFDGE